MKHNDAWHTEEYKGFTIELYQDEDAENPRKGWDNLGTMLCVHPRYDLGDEARITAEDIVERIFGTWEGYQEGKVLPGILVLPLVLLDHSGLWMKVGSSWSVDPGGWDTSKVGYIYVTHKDILKEWKRKHLSMGLLLKAENTLRAEVAVYSDYLEGNVVGWVVRDKDDEVMDSVWGYYGDEGAKYAISEAKAHIDHRVPDDLWKLNRVGEQVEMFQEEEVRT